MATLMTPTPSPSISFPCTLGMVFGVFDGLHPGHHHFLREAETHCSQLIVVVARDRVVEDLKHKTPTFSERERHDTLQAAFPNARVILGDTTQGSWGPLQYHPDCVFLGYDQATLGDALQARGQRVHTLSPHEPHRYKSSLLHKKADQL